MLTHELHFLSLACTLENNSSGSEDKYNIYIYDTVAFKTIRDQGEEGVSNVVCF